MASTKNITTIEQCTKLIEETKLVIAFNNKLNAKIRKYIKDTNWNRNEHNGYWDDATPDMIDAATKIVEDIRKEIPISENLAKRYLDKRELMHIFCGTWSIAVNRYILIDLHDLEKHLETLKKANETPEEKHEEKFETFKVIRDLENQRLNIDFGGRVDKQVYGILIHNGFRYSPKYEVFTRQLTDNAERSLKAVKETLARFEC